MNLAKTVMFNFPEKNHPHSLRIVQDPTSQIRGIYFPKSQAKLLEEIEFNKPSMPAELCSGSAQNGWLFWKGLDDRRRAEQ